MLEGGAAAWLAAIVESSDDAIIGKTLDSIIRSWNAGAERTFGYRAREIVGKSVLTLMPPELRHEEDDIVARLSRGQRIEHFETTRLRKDGTRIDVSLSVSPILNQRGEIIGATQIARDVTEAKRLQRLERDVTEQLQELAAELEQQVEEAQSLQEELEQTNEQLAEALRDAESARAAADNARLVAEHANAAKSQFLATMSHELRTPLNAISGYVELLEMGLRGPLTDLQRHDLNRIRQSQESLLRLIEDVLSFAKLGSGRLEYRFENVRMDTLLESLEAFVSPRLAQKGLKYRVEPCGGDVIAFIDRAKVEQIALNLLSNAVKFTDHGGLEVSCRTTETEIRVAVHDTGPGISQEFLETIFEPFVQGERSLTRTGEGTGLGLAISRQLARGMGGDIAVESAPGVGSTFTLILPRNSFV
jgi:PAS domain S-box-containing protein